MTATLRVAPGKGILQEKNKTYSEDGDWKIETLSRIVGGALDP